MPGQIFIFSFFLIGSYPLEVSQKLKEASKGFLHFTWPSGVCLELKDMASGGKTSGVFIFFCNKQALF